MNISQIQLNISLIRLKDSYPILKWVRYDLLGTVFVPAGFETRLYIITKFQGFVPDPEVGLDTTKVWIRPEGFVSDPELSLDTT